MAALSKSLVGRIMRGASRIAKPGRSCGYRKCHPRASGRNFTRSMSSNLTRLSPIRTIALLIL